MPIFIYVPLVVLGVLAVVQYLALAGAPAPSGVRGPVVGIVTILSVENAYYGFGRLFPDAYDDLSWWWPGVLSMKVGYVIALAMLNMKLANK